MKKRNLTSLKLNKKTITNLQAGKNIGGRRGASTTLCDSQRVCCA